MKLIDNTNIKNEQTAMLEALGCITSSWQYHNGSKLTSSANFILFLQRKFKHEGVSCKQTRHRLFLTTREYESGGKPGEKIVVKVGNRGDEMVGGGDERTQDLLAEIALLETQKMKVVEFMEERSDHLREMAEETNSEMQQIADDTMKGMDEAGLKVLENVEAEVRACEEELALERAKMQMKEQQIDSFEKQTWEGRNEGLFFKSLFTPAKKWKEIPSDKKNTIRMEAETLKNVTKKTLNSNIRRTLYLFLILVLSVTLIDAISSGNADWPKLALYAVLLLIIVTQLTYETIFSSKEK